MKRLTLLSATVMLGILHAGQPGTPVPMREGERMSGEMETLSASVAPKVVQIATQGLKVAEPGDAQPAGVLVAGHGSGSGFFVSSDGYLLTNAHVVANATRIRVLVQPADGSARPGELIEYPGKVAGVDADNDLALVKVEVTGVPCFDLNDGRAARQGQWAMAYGSPLGLAQSATMGLVSAVDRQLNSEDPRTYIQTDAPINPGNSGGPLVDLQGRLLGINTLILTQSGGSEGLGFAVPLETIQRSYALLRERGTVSRPLLGIRPRSLSAEFIAGLHLPVHEGVLVEDVAPYSASSMGLQPGDVLLSLDAQPIHNLRDLYRVESSLTAGTAVEAVAMRDGTLRHVRITPEAPRETPPALQPANVTEKENLVLRLGIYGATVTPPVAGSLGGLRAARGVLVLALAGTSLGSSGIEPGDVVHEVNGRPVDSVAGLRAVLEGLPEDAPAVLQLERAGVLSYLALGALPNAPQTVTRASLQF